MRNIQKAAFLYAHAFPKSLMPSLLLNLRFVSTQKEEVPLFGWMKKKSPDKIIPPKATNDDNKESISKADIKMNTSKTQQKLAPKRQNKVKEVSPQDSQLRFESFFAPSEIEPKDDLPLKLKQDISRSNYVQNILEIYETNKGVFTPNSLSFLIIRISKLFSKLMDDIETLQKNPIMRDFVRKLQGSISAMNISSLVNTMIFFRKLRDRKYFSEWISKDDFENLVHRFKTLTFSNKLTFNEACLFYYESCYVRTTTAATFKFIEEVLKTEGSKQKINAYYLTILMKALIMNKDFKKSETFWRNLLEHVNYQIEILKDINILSQFFELLLQLDSQNNFSQSSDLSVILKRCCSNLVSIFRENVKILVNFDLLIILKGYSTAPAWLEKEFLQEISEAIIVNFDDEKLYDFNFRLRFLEYMGKSDLLDKKTVKPVLEKVLKRLKSIDITNGQFMFQIIKSCEGYNCFERTKIFEFISETMNNMELAYKNSLQYLLIAKKLLDSNFDCKELVLKIADFYQENLRGTYIERIALIWDVAFHPFFLKDDSFNTFRQGILESLLAKIKAKKQMIYKIIDILGDKIKTLAKTQPLMQEFLKNIEAASRNKIEERSAVDNLKYEMFFNSEIADQSAILKIMQIGKFGTKKLSSSDLEMFLKFFRTKEVKISQNLTLLKRAVSNSDAQAVVKNLALIIIVACELPHEFLLQNPGQAVDFLRNVFENIPSNIDFSEIGITYQSFLDLSDFFDKNGLYEFHYHGVLLAREVLKTKIIEEISLNKVSEIGLTIASGIKRAEFRNMMKEDHAILIGALRKIAEFLEEKIIVDLEAEKKDMALIHGQTTFLSRFLRIYYKAFMADLKSRDPVFIQHSIEKVSHLIIFEIYLIVKLLT